MELEAWGIDCHHEEQRGGRGGGPDAWALGGSVRSGLRAEKGAVLGRLPRCGTGAP